MCVSSRMLEQSNNWPFSSVNTNFQLLISVIVRWEAILTITIMITIIVMLAGGQQDLSKSARMAMKDISKMNRSYRAC